MLQPLCTQKQVPAHTVVTCYSASQQSYMVSQDVVIVAVVLPSACVGSHQQNNIYVVCYSHQGMSTYLLSLQYSLPDFICILYTMYMMLMRFILYIYIFFYILLEPNIKDAGGNINLIYSRRE